jgi:nicotinate phosphoribosyltransferase
MMRTDQQVTAEGILFTDQYQLTMAQLYYRMGLHERPAQFDHFFRSNPDYGAHQAGYCVNARLEWLLDWMQGALPRHGSGVSPFPARAGRPADLR